MGKPLMIFGLRNIVNESFEDSNSTPTSWDTSQSVNGDIAISTTESHSAGVGFPSSNSLRLNVATNTAANKSIVAQRFAVSDLETLSVTRDRYIAGAVMVKYVNAQAQTNTLFQVKLFSGGTTAIGSGTPVSPSAESRTHYSNANSDWQLLVHKVKLTSAVTYIEISLEYEIDTSGDYDATAYTYFDRAFLGGVVDFAPDNKGLASLKMAPDTGYSMNVGDGVVELVKIAKASTEIEFEINNVLEDTDLDNDLKMMMEWMGGATPGLVAFWADRTLHRNSERHYQYCVVDPKSPKYEYPAGYPRRLFQFKLAAPKEFA